MQQKIEAAFKTYRDTLSNFIQEQRQYGQNALFETGSEEFSRIIALETSFVCELADTMIRNSITLEQKIAMYPDQLGRTIDLLRDLENMANAFLDSCRAATKRQLGAFERYYSQTAPRG
jgi:hypothetical protein